MLMRETTVKRAGRTYTGRYKVTGSGSTASVLVQLDSAVICARKGTLPEREVAETLLGELVQEALAEVSNKRRH